MRHEFVLAVNLGRFCWMLQTPRMPTCGGLSTGVKLDAKGAQVGHGEGAAVEFVRRDLALQAGGCQPLRLVESWRSVSELASRTTGTIKPLAVSTATPKCTLRYW